MRILGALVLAAAAFGGDWPQWRGPDLNGISQENSLPLRWTTEENITWKLPLPAWSGSTPILWGERIFLNVADGNDLYLWCVDRSQAAVLWKKHLGGGNVKMRKQNMSSPSPVTDGKNVWVMTGTGILKSFDFNGNEIWGRDLQKDYGAFGLNHGYGSSPLLYEDSLYVQVLHGMKTDDPSYLLRIDKKTGKTLWRVERPTDAVQESPDSYTTPALLRYGRHTEIVITGGDYVTGHDPATGKELWRGGGFNLQKEQAYRIIASPVVFDGLIYCPTRVRPLLVFRAGGRGDISQSHRAWAFQNGPDVPTPVTDGKRIFVVNDRGIVVALDAKTGRISWDRQRIEAGTYSSSPLLADAKIYAVNEEGTTTVLSAGDDFEVLAVNRLDSRTLASPVAVGNQLFIRTADALYCLAKK